MFTLIAIENSGEVSDGVGVLIDKDVFNRVALYVRAIAPATRMVFAGQTIAVGDKVVVSTVDFYLGVLGVDMLAIVIRGIDKVVGILGHLERLRSVLSLYHGG